VNAGGLPGAAGTGTSFTQYTINYFNLLLSFLGLGGISAAVYAMLQPTHLRLTNDGVSFLYKRRPFGKVRFTPWSKIKQLRILSRKGTTMLGDKQLEFRGDRNALIKFKLNCIDSISSREAILKGIESWAPNVKRDADVIQTLQRPPEQSYTDLWLQALVAPPKRDRLKPLITNSSLQDGHYSVVKTIGLGGQGTAYLARDTKTSQLVVLKEFILPIYVDINVRKAALERFENEARILKGLDCAQIVKLVDFFVEDHRGYLALEYIDGEDLKTKVERNGKLTEKEVLNYAIQMCEILNYLHKQVPPVIHRDFTPDNLILQLNGSLKLIDFNVAQQTNDTITGTIVGKQCYLPPEQFQGEPVIQSDIYSMGATLFFLATGSPPSPISQSHPKEFNSELSKNFDDFVARATTIDTGLRYTSATECLEELKRILNTGDKA
jgi:tRNA A-37 threonylcarbamoyl transferase component Bud32